jgi:U6 snRNA-associated Sm-like protein LSm4
MKNEYTTYRRLIGPDVLLPTVKIDEVESRKTALLDTRKAEVQYKHMVSSPKVVLHSRCKTKSVSYFQFPSLQLPLSLLNVASGSPLLVELKGGDTYNGRLESCDSWMNMNLTEVICTSKDGDRFWKLPTCYIRGSAIKYLRLPPQLLEKAREEGLDQERQGEWAYL